VVEVIGQRRVHVRQGDGRLLSYDFVRAHPDALVPDSDIRDRDSVPGDSRLSAAHPRRRHYAVSRSMDFRVRAPPRCGPPPGMGRSPVSPSLPRVAGFWQNRVSHSRSELSHSLRTLTKPNKRYELSGK
jgi:hypothetical protein